MSNLLYRIGHASVRLYASMMFKVDIRWHERLPNGAKIFVANHPSGTDPFMIHLLAPMNVLVTANAFSLPLFGKYIRATGQIPVLPGKGEQALNEASDLLKEGRSVGIFPEGTYSPQDGGFLEPHTGAARLALKTGAMVIPVGIYLIREKSFNLSLHLGGKHMQGYWYLYGPYVMTVGKPITFHGDPEHKEDIQCVTQNMMTQIQSLAMESEMRARTSMPAMAKIPTKPA